ncbi:MAG: TetR/AcrR family transcriptional regulator [bacterium]|nr:TetR/AcrR family transcriptional regulator [bacterium]
MAEAIEDSPASAPADPESTRERILDVAEALFAERGLAGTAVRDIAREAGLTAPSLYNHFDGKQALYEAVLARGVQPLFAIITATNDEAGALSVEERQTASDRTLDAIMDHLAHHPNIAKLIQHESLTGGPSLSHIVHGWIGPIVESGLGAMSSRLTVWSEDEQPMAVAAWIHVILGHFTMAPLFRELFGADPLAPEQIELQKRFLRRFARVMLAPVGESESD